MVFVRVVFEALFRPFSTANLRNKKTTSKFSAEKNLTKREKWGLIFNELQRWLEKKSYRAKIYALTPQKFLPLSPPLQKGWGNQGNWGCRVVWGNSEVL